MKKKSITKKEVIKALKLLEQYYNEKINTPDFTEYSRHYYYIFVCNIQELLKELK
jgi:hypothetical protein